MITAHQQMDHIQAHFAEFEHHTGYDSVEEYFVNIDKPDIYWRLCDDLGITPLGPYDDESAKSKATYAQFGPKWYPNTHTNAQGGDVSINMGELEKLELQLSFGINDDGDTLTDTQRHEVEAKVAALKTPDAQEPQPQQPQPQEEGWPIVDLTTDASDAAPAATPSQAQQPDLSQMIAQQIQQQLGQIQQPQQVSLEDVLKAIDPRDSDSALLLLDWLQQNSRLSVVATLSGGGGYLYHYSEPKGTSNQGYTPGSTQGGRMVDQAVQKAQEQGAKPRKTGMCDQCWSAVEQLDDGSVVLDDDTKSAVCSAGGTHSFNA